MLVRELARLGPAELLTRELHPGQAGDEMDFRFLRSLLPRGANPIKGLPAQVNGPLPGALLSHEKVHSPGVRGTFNVGYAVNELNFPADCNGLALEHFDHLVAVSNWYADVLRAAGLTNVSVILQGINPRFFNDRDNAKTLFQDRFVLFSGGKFEFRKGQDFVVRAFRILQQRHEDVILVNSWVNPSYGVWTFA